MRERPSAGCVCSWLQHSAGSWHDRQHPSCVTSLLCTSCTARRTTAASASASSHQGGTCCPCSAGPWPSLSLWPCWLLCQSSTNNSSLQRRPLGFGPHSPFVTHSWWCTCRVRSMRTVMPGLAAVFICLTPWVCFGPAEEQHCLPSSQAVFNAVVVRLGGLMVLMLTVGRWADVLHILMCFLGEASCLIPANDLLDAASSQVSQNHTHERAESTTSPVKPVNWGRISNWVPWE